MKLPTNPNDSIRLKKLSFLLFAVAAFFCYCGNKDVNVPNNPPAPSGPTTNPSPTSVTTTVFAYFWENRYNNPSVNIFFNQKYLPYINSTHNSSTFTGDPYNNILNMEYPSNHFTFFPIERIIPLTASKRNYLEVGSKTNKELISIPYTLAGVADLPGGGKLSYGANAFGPFYGGALSGFGYFGYVDPNANGFSLKLPSLHTVIDNKSWFLKNYGTYFVQLPKPVDPSSYVRLFTKIPANLLSNSPDSIETWLYVNKRWIPKGYAIKSGDEYNKKIDGSGIWAFATPVKGAYTKLKVRNSSGTPVINAIVQLTNSLQQEVAGVRTDMDGNAICFIPTGEVLTAKVFGYWYLSDWVIHSQVLSPITATEDITLTIPVSHYRMITLKGSAKECSGSSIQNGSLEVKDPNGDLIAHLPISNGQYAGSFVSAFNSTTIFINTFNDATGKWSGDSAVNITTGIEQTVNVTYCLPTTSMYAKYSTMDGGPVTTIAFDAPLPDSVKFQGTEGWSSGNVYTKIEGMSGKKGFTFQAPISISSIGTFSNLVGINNLWIDSVSYQARQSMPARITITRSDFPGYIEGTADFYYSRTGTAIRHFVGTFRLKRLQ